MAAIAATKRTNLLQVDVPVAPGLNCGAVSTRSEEAR
jgi:hypothetical protein